LNWKERAAIFLTDKGGGPLPPKLTKAPLVSLVSTGGPAFQEIKNTGSSTKCQSYHFVLRGDEGGGIYLTEESDLDAARNQLLKRYGDRLLLVTNAAPD
jgi:hypothetical protein